jgi:putative ABC transport system permease protein
VWRRPAYLASVLAIGVGFTVICFWLSGSWQVSAYFILGLIGSLLLLRLIAGGLLLAARSIVRAAGRALPSNLRHGFANLYRPGTHASAILVALGVGVLFTLSTYLIQRAVIRDVQTDAPARGGNVFLLDVRPSQRDEVARFIAAQPGVAKPPNMVGYFVARMLVKNGTPVQDLPLTKERKDQLQTSRISIVGNVPREFELVSGKFWNPKSTQPQIAISDDESRRFGFRIGDHLQYQAAGRLIDAPIVAIYHPNKSAAFRFDILFPQDATAGIPAIYFGSAQVTASAIPELEGALFERFPTITVMNLADILQRVQEAVDQVALVIRFLAAFAIFAGIVILCSSVAGSRHRRMREVAVLKTLGATRRRVTAIFSIEFSILGAVAGFVGGILANVFTDLLARRFIQAPFRFDWLSVLIATIAMIALANAAGWLASARVLRLKPLEVLRSE